MTTPYVQATAGGVQEALARTSCSAQVKDQEAWPSLT